MMQKLKSSNPRKGFLSVIIETIFGVVRRLRQLIHSCAKQIYNLFSLKNFLYATLSTSLLCIAHIAAQQYVQVSFATFLGVSYATAAAYYLSQALHIPGRLFQLASVLLKWLQRCGSAFVFGCKSVMGLSLSVKRNQRRPVAGSTIDYEGKPVIISDFSDFYDHHLNQEGKQPTLHCHNYYTSKFEAQAQRTYNEVRDRVKTTVSKDASKDQQQGVLFAGPDTISLLTQAFPSLKVLTNSSIYHITKNSKCELQEINRMVDTVITELKSHQCYDSDIAQELAQVRNGPAQELTEWDRVKELQEALATAYTQVLKRHQAQLFELVYHQFFTGQGNSVKTEYFHSMMCKLFQQISSSSYRFFVNFKTQVQRPYDEWVTKISNAEPATLEVYQRNKNITMLYRLVDYLLRAKHMQVHNSKLTGHYKLLIAYYGKNHIDDLLKHFHTSTPDSSQLSL